MPPVTNTPDDTTVASLYHQWRESLDRGELQTATYIAGPHAHLIDLLQQRINEHFSCSAAQQDETLTQEAQTATSAHYDAIYAAHKDADEIVESAEFAAWRDALPAFAKAGVEHALTKGAAKDVIEVFDAFRATKPPQPNTSTARSAPEAPVRRVPNSLSDVPGAAPMDETQQTLAAAGNTAALLDRMAAMTQEQRDALLDNLI